MNRVFPMRAHTGEIWTAGKINRRRPSEGELAERFAERHCREVRYWAVHKRWIAWDGEEWLHDTQNLALHLARGICREAAEAYGDHTLDSHRSAAGVVALAKCDPRLVVSDWPCHPDLETAVDEWIEERCVLNSDAWTPRPALLASFAAWERFDAEELTAAWERRGIVYRRKGNVHGFDGVRLRDEDDE
jgi:hypothetical protein